MGELNVNPADLLRIADVYGQLAARASADLSACGQ
jgi:imidazolonepropionase-like amidohydrolase